MTPEEANIRCERAWKIVNTRFLDLLLSNGSVEDYHDALEIAMLWRMTCEGARLSPMTNARLLAATNDLPPQSGMTKKRKP